MSTLTHRLRFRRQPADKWADRGRLRPAFEEIELARPFDQIEVVYRVLHLPGGRSLLRHGGEVELLSKP